MKETVTPVENRGITVNEQIPDLTASVFLSKVFQLTTLWQDFLSHAGLLCHQQEGISILPTILNGTNLKEDSEMIEVE